MTSFWPLRYHISGGSLGDFWEGWLKGAILPESDQFSTLWSLFFSFWLVTLVWWLDLQQPSWTWGDLDNTIHTLEWWKRKIGVWVPDVAALPDANFQSFYTKEKVTSISINFTDFRVFCECTQIWSSLVQGPFKTFCINLLRNVETYYRYNRSS